MTPRSCCTRAPSARAGTLGHFATAAIVCFAAAQLSAQAVWSLAAPCDIGPAMAWDAAGQQTIRFGLSTGLQTGAPLAITWSWNGTAWSRLYPAHSPSPRAWPGMACDPVRRRVVMFGGFDGYTVFDDTWEWDGSDWSLCTPAVRPSPRQSPAMTFDTVRGRTLLFGGSSQFLTGMNSNDTWEWDGSNWTQRQPANRPLLPQYQSVPSMAFDPVRGRAVLLQNGAYVIAGSPDLWEWDGSNWSVCVGALGTCNGTTLAFDPSLATTVFYTPVSSTPLAGATFTWDGVSMKQRGTGGPRCASAMVFDARRNCMVLAGGYRDYRRNLFDTESSNVHEWNGTTWVERAACPPPKMAAPCAAMSYHLQSRRTVLFDRGTWGWDGIQWSLLAAEAQSPVVDGLALADDLVRGRVVLFGGQSSSLQPVTWEWDGNLWMQRQPTISPPGRLGHAMAYDSLRGRVVLYGGFHDPFSYSDTWEYDGITWTQRFPATQPPALQGHCMAYDMARGQTVMNGGFNPWAGAQNTTWTWDGQTWTLQQPVHRPRWGNGQSLAYDSRRARCVLFSADISPQDSSTWEWDGTDWQLTANLASQNPTPTRRSYTLMAYDHRNAQVVMFGGYGNFRQYPYQLSDTWVYGPAADLTAFGSGCAGALGVPTLTPTMNRPPRLGQTAQLDLGNLPLSIAVLASGLDNAWAGPLPLPFDLAFLGMPGCNLLVDPLHEGFVFGSGGSALHSLPIPSAPVLTGVQLYLQAFVLDPTANARGMTVSNGVRLVIGL